jgi:hypothetical protein
MKRMITLMAFCFCAIAFAGTEMLDRDFDQPVVSEQNVLMPETGLPVWSELQRMTDAEKANALIDIELPSDANQNAIRLSGEIGGLWNGGHYSDALALFTSLAAEVNSARISIGISWRTPVFGEDASLWGPDVRIGDRDSVYQTSMDIQRSTGALFSILTLKQGSVYYFTVNRSSNNGQTWAETHAWGGGGDSIRSASATCMSNYCWVGYGTKVYPYEARVRRFDAATGLEHGFSGGAYVTVFAGAAPDTVKEVLLFSNQDQYNNRLYCMAITSTGNLRYFWAETSATVWHEVTTSISNASSGVSATWNQNYSTYPWWFSYISENDSLMIYNINQSNVVTFSFQTLAGSGTRYTSISAYDDTVFCAFEYYISTFGCKYEVNYGDASWYWGRLGDTTIICEAPSITARYGGGIGAIYRHYTSPRQGRYVHRTYQYMAWPTPTTFTGYEPWYNKPSLEYLGSNDYGVVYVTTSSPVFHAAFFDRLAASDIEFTPTLPNTFALAQNYPNPFNASTCIEYNTPKSTNVKVEIYDILGRKVQTLIDQYQQAGQHSLIWNADENSSGVYFARITADKESQMIRMMLLK